MTTHPRLLYPLGWRRWDEVRPLLDGFEGAWADLDGWHQGPLPADAPLATHVWAWNPRGDVLVRLRCDGDSCVGAVLAHEGADPPPVTDGTGPSLVTVDTGVSRPWNDDLRLSDELPRDSIWRLETTVDDAPITFVRPADTSGA